jgi:hypothetical protein
MITLSRSQLVGAKMLDERTIRFNGIQEDHIYGMEIQMDVRVPEGEILAIEGRMKRYTTPICPSAVDQLRKAVGMALRGENWESAVMKVIGRQGCQHFAEIIIECGRCLDPARLAGEMEEALKTDPCLDQTAFAGDWVKRHDEVKGTCAARP